MKISIQRDAVQRFPGYLQNMISNVLKRVHMFILYNEFYGQAMQLKNDKTDVLRPDPGMAFVKMKDLTP